MSVEIERDRDTADHDQEALQEIRLLFDRYRRIARHGVVAERHEAETAQAETTEDGADRTG